jgi:hypothetical protein
VKGAKLLNASYASLDDDTVIFIVISGGGEALMAANELGYRLERRSNKAPLEAKCRKYLGGLPGELVFTIGPAGNHVKLGAPR